MNLRYERDWSDTRWTAPFFGIQHLRSMHRGYVTVVAYASFAIADLTPRGTFESIATREFDDAASARAWAEQQARALGWLRS